LGKLEARDISGTYRAGRDIEAWNLCGMKEERNALSLRRDRDRAAFSSLTWRKIPETASRGQEN